ncbi:MAG TPA: hypothetical protein VF112_00110 [Candidatus Dormibacteraeota bacterium]
MSAPAHGRVPFELHRVAEVVLGLTLVSFSLHVTGSLATLLGGLVVMVPALVTRGRLGVLRRVSVRAHRVLDMLLVAMLVLLPLAPHSEGLALATVTEPAAAVLVLLVVRTDYRPRARAGAPAPTPGPPAPPLPGPSVADRAGRSVGRWAGILERAARAAVDRDRR